MTNPKFAPTTENKTSNTTTERPKLRTSIKAGDRWCLEGARGCFIGETGNGCAEMGY